jgi:anti-sigma factor RsiW
MITHHRIERQLSAYLDRELAPAEMAGVHAHLAVCDACRTELEELRAGKDLLGRLRVMELPPGFEASLLAKISRPSRTPWFAWPRPAMALAAAALAVVLVAVPVVRDHRARLRAAEVSSDLFVRTAVQSAAADPFMDRAYIGLVSSDSSLRLMGEDPRGPSR